VQRVAPSGLDEVDPELLRTFDKLGISIDEQKRLTVLRLDVVMDSISVKTTSKKHLLNWVLSFVQ